MYIGLGAAIGSLIGTYLNPSLPLLLVSIGVISAVTILSLKTKKIWLSLVCVSCVIFTLNAYLRVPQIDKGLLEVLEKVKDGKALFEGEVWADVFRQPKEVEDIDIERYQFIMRLRRYTLKNEEQSVDYYVLARANLHSLPLRCGDIIRFYGRIKPIENNSYLRYKGIFAVVTISPGGLISLDHRGGARFSDIKTALCERLEKVFGQDAESSGFAQAILLGERRALTQDVVENLRKTGLAHFLAISGIHLALVAMFVGFVAQRLSGNRRVTLIVVIGFSFIYFLIGGMSPSLFRALVVVLVYLIGVLIGRKSDGFNTLGAAVTIILLIRPFDILTLSFQLSFITFGGIIGLYPLLWKVYLERKNLIFELKGYSLVNAPFGERAKIWLVTMMFMATAAWLSAQPLVSRHFHIIPYGSVLSNIIVLPILYLALALGILVLTFVSFSLILAYPFAKAFSLLFSISKFLTSHIASLHLFTFTPNRWIPDFNIVSILLFYGLLVLASIRLRGYLMFLKPRHFVVLVLLGLSLWIFGGKIVGMKPSLPQDSATFLAVGQAQTVILNTKDGVILYDCGTRRCPKETAGLSIAQELWKRGIYSVDAIVLSHPDSDHINGVEGLAERIKIRTVFVSEHFEKKGEGEDLLKRLGELGVKTEKIKPPVKIGKSIEVVAPLVDKLFERDLSPNNMSLGLLVRLSDSTRLFLTGDMESEEMGTLIVLDAVPQAEFLQLPHHGAKHPLLYEFIAKVGAEKFIISGQMRDIGYSLEGGDVYSTGECGAITVLSDGTVLTEKGEREWMVLERR